VAGDKEREVRLQELSQKVRDLLLQCGNCAQTTFFVLREEFDLDGQEILKALTPFPGLALRGETCGAVTGSLMAIGLVFGRDSLDDWKGYTSSLRSARHFCKRFVDLQGRALPVTTSLRLHSGAGLTWPIGTNRPNTWQQEARRNAAIWWQPPCAWRRK